jgi:hypothetical protein
VLEGHLRSTQRDHLADAFGTCVSVAVECYDGFIWRRQVFGVAPRQTLRLVICRATRKLEEA